MLLKIIIICWKIGQRKIYRENFEELYLFKLELFKTLILYDKFLQFTLDLD